MPLAKNYNAEETTKVTAWLEARRRTYNAEMAQRAEIVAKFRRSLSPLPPPRLRQDIALQASPTIREHSLGIVVQKDKGSREAIGWLIAALAKRDIKAPSVAVSVGRNGPTRIIHVSWD